MLAFAVLAGPLPGCGGHGAMRKVGTADAMIVSATGSCADTVVEAQLAGRPGSAFTAARHADAAAALALLRAGEVVLAAGDAEEARACAVHGLATLGDRYADPTDVDDTELKLAAADERAEAGALADAARVTLTVLHDRLAMYRRLWRAELEPLPESPPRTRPEEP